ncbi:MAG: helix-turn-helix transcriptional regulator [Lysobacter sp.]|nr:helix-turn-helix transcriptional regulator [Lysobacter sp.]
MNDSASLHAHPIETPRCPRLDVNDHSTQPLPPLDIDALLQRMNKGWIQLDGDILRRLRLSRYMSQQDLANDCWHRDIRVSIATIKRAECGHPVRFRIARELARCFGVPVEQLLRLSA